MEARTNILVVDHDASLCRVLQRYLQDAGFHVDIVFSGAAMFEQIKRREPKLILLDLKLPDAHGFELVKQLRQNSNVGIIMITGGHDQFDKVVGLEMGADDYVDKPFEERELLARIRSVLRRADQETTGASEGHARASFSGWIVDFVAHEVHNAQQETIHLTSHEYDLLTIFLHNPARVLSREQILDKVYGRDWDQSDRSIDILVGKLRRKLGDSGDDPQIIKTVRGAGYILTTRVELS